MRTATRFLQALSLLLLLSAGGFAADWHGIVPLHSTRSDVERLLGKPKAGHNYYEIENEIAEIYYSKGPCANGWRVPLDTVILIAVHFQETRRLADLNIDLNRFERVLDQVMPSHAYYINRNAGLRYEVLEVEQSLGTVLTVFYESTAEDEKLLYCKDSTPVHNLCTADVCPSIFIFCSGECHGPEYTLTASYVVSCPEKRPTYKWKLSNGRITKGQGTDTITVKPRKSKNPVTVTVRIDNAIPTKCPNTQRYVIKYPTVREGKTHRLVTTRPAGCR